MLSRKGFNNKFLFDRKLFVIEWVNLVVRPLDIWAVNGALSLVKEESGAVECSLKVGRVEWLIGCDLVVLGGVLVQFQG